MKKTLSFLLLLCLLLLPAAGCAAEAPQSASVPASPAPETVTATPQPQTAKPIDFSVNRAALSPAALTYLDGDAADYEALVDAVCRGDETAELSADASRAVEVLLETPYGALATLEADGGTVYITPQAGSADAVDAAVAALVQRTVFEDMNAFETALALYRTVSAFTFEESEENSLYRMLTAEKGNDADFAGALHYLLTQMGIPSALAYSPYGGDEHIWVVAELSGMRFHFDPTFENSATKGAGLTYFAMSDARRAYTGCDAPYAFIPEDTEFDALSDDTRFDELFDETTGWQLDTASHMLFLAYGFGTDYQTTLSTETFQPTAG